MTDTHVISEASAVLAAAEKDTVHIALSVYDPKGTYSRHAGVVVASVLDNTDAHVCFHILHDETLTAENREKLTRTALETRSGKSGLLCGTINFVDVSDAFNKIMGVDIEKISLRFTKGALFRLAVPDVLPDLIKLIYLACDMVVTLDIGELWNKDIKGCAFAAVPLRNVTTEDDTLPLPDYAVTRDKIKTNKMGLSEERYVNSGMLLMDLHKIRERFGQRFSLMRRAFDYIVKHNALLPDEQYLNEEFLGDIMFLERRFNADPGDEQYENVFAIQRIWHFGGHSKVWNAFSGSNADVLYWHYLTCTPWKNELIESMFKAGTNPAYYHRHSKGCISRLKSQLKSNIQDIGRQFKK